MNEMTQLSVSEKVSTPESSRFGRLLIENGKINKDQLATILVAQNKHGLRFGDAAVQLGFINENDVQDVLAMQFKYNPAPDINSRLDKRLYAAFQPDSKQAEALRSLRSELWLRYFNKENNLSLALVSCEDAAGLALMTANLAVTFAQLGLRTLAIDANLREPQLHHLFDINDRELGFSDLIAGRSAATPIAVPEIHSLWVMPAGTPIPNAQELLAHKEYAPRVEEVSKSFDVILINTPPSTEIRDAQIIATHAGACLLVAQQHNSRVKSIKQLCSGLAGLGVRLLGVALKE